NLPSPSIAALSALLWLAAAPAAEAQIPLPSSIDDASFGPLASGNVYVASGTVVVPAGTTLTVQPDVVVKFPSNASFDVSGTLLVNGTPALPVTFTSIRDDVGIVTDAAPPAPGDWRQLSITAGGSASRLNSLVVRYAGMFETAGLALATGADVVMNGVAVRDSASAGLECGANAAASSGARPTVTGCSFVDNQDEPVVNVHLNALAAFSGNSASGNLGGDTILVRNGTLVQSMTLAADAMIGGAFRFEASLVLNPPHALTITEGVVLKFQPSPLGTLPNANIGATLFCQGTDVAPIVFTSVDDDSIAGDSAGDGPTTGSPGDWQGLRFTGTAEASALESVVVRFAGAFQAGGVTLSGADVTLRDVAVESSLTDGLSLTTSQPTVVDCRFDDNLGAAVSALDWPALQGVRDNAAANNALGDVIVVSDVSVPGGSTRIDRWNGLNGTGVVVAKTQTSLLAGAALTFGAGVIVKFSNPSDSGLVSGAGTLLFDGFGHAPVVLTTITDDAFGGDTNGDGAASVPAPGAWRRVLYGPTAGTSRMEHVHLRFPGFGGTAGVALDAPSVSMDAVRVDQSAGHGIVIEKNGGGLRNLVAFVNLGDGIVIDEGSNDILYATSAANFGRGIVSGPNHTGGCDSSIGWFNANGGSASNNIVGFPSVVSCNGSPFHDGTNGNILADPGFVDPDQGDLTLGLFSHSIGRGNPFTSQLTGEDFDGNSRTLDHNLFGTALPDQGAYEYHVYHMEIEGDARVGKSFTLRVEPNPLQNPGGFAHFFVGPGFSGVGLFTPPFGYLLIGANPIFLTSIPTGASLTLPVPDQPNFVGVPFGIQPAVTPLGNTTVGHWTNPFLGTVRL
ncbi:MAG: hypothetical protein ACF8XB_10450, partial [Planctomycetota bacterium JB042]